MKFIPEPPAQQQTVTYFNAGIKVPCSGYIATDANGEVYLYDGVPNFDEKEWRWVANWKNTDVIRIGRFLHFPKSKVKSSLQYVHVIK